MDLIASTTYNSIRKTVQYLSDIPPHPELETFQINMPATHATVIANWRVYIEALVKRLSEQPTQPTHVVAVIDTIASKPGVVLPWKEMVKICKEHAIWTVVDGAHSIGQEQNIEVAKSGCDFWVSVSARCDHVLLDHAHYLIELLQMVDVQT